MPLPRFELINTEGAMGTSREHDSYEQTHVYPYIEQLWNYFLEMHPEYLSEDHSEKGIEYMTPLLTFQEAMTSQDMVRIVKHQDTVCTLAEAAQDIHERAKGLADKAAVAMYMSWFEKHRREIKNDFGAIVEKKPEVVNESQNTEEQLQQAA